MCGCAQSAEALAGVNTHDPQVKKGYRRQGYGSRIWSAGLARLAGRTLGLDGAVARQGQYEKSGFKPAYHNIRYAGVCGGCAPANPAVLNLTRLNFDAVRSYDQHFYPADRSRFLAAWLRQPDSITLCIMGKDRLSGYGMIRVCRSGFRIGPLFADTPGLAEALFVSLKSRVQAGSPLFLDVPELNQDGVALAEKQGMKTVFATARMYRGAIPVLPLNRLFGVTTFELG